MYTLYVFPGACSLASHLALETSGATFEVMNVDFRHNQQRTPEYLATNPKGRVPALVTPQGTLTENPAILLYLGQRFPQAKMIPDDIFQLARMSEFNAFLSSTVHVAHAHGPRGSRWSDDEAAQASMKARVPANMRDCFRLIEDSYFQGPWVMGEQYTVGDMYLFTIATWLETDQVDIGEFPRVADFRARMLADDTVKRVMNRERALLA
ncbi:MAG: glutathione S-transferase family protein [Pseudomonadales bacterium]|nr:glutathione S-transferase family protein [Pseudomonadales bacterium]